MLLKFPFLKYFNVCAIALWPFIGLQSNSFKKDRTLLNHERIHLQQQKELLVLPFYLWYLLEYFWHRTSMSHHQAYRSIIFEKEAFENESNLDYLKTRRTWQFMKFNRKHS